MSNKIDKIKKLTKVKPKTYKIYGIFNFEKEELVHVGMKLDDVLLEYDLEGYDEKEFDVIFFETMIF